jgi:hypothetical protein
MNVASSVLRRMAVILKANTINLFVFSVLFVFWYHSRNFLDPPGISVLRYFRDNYGCDKMVETVSLWMNMEKK